MGDVTDFCCFLWTYPAVACVNQDFLCFTVETDVNGEVIIDRKWAAAVLLFSFITHDEVFVGFAGEFSCNVTHWSMILFDVGVTGYKFAEEVV